MPAPTHADFLAAAEAIAAAAEPVTMRYFRSDQGVDRKADETPVTAADRETERTIREGIAERFPEHGILGEEFGAANTDAEHVWIIDPIDGTKSFISGVPLFGTLLGLLEGGAPVAGVIQMAGLGERFAGGAGLGATMNGRPVRCRTGVRLADAFLCINETAELFDGEPELLARLLRTGRYPRTTMDCYPYCQLAAGWVDAVVDYDLEPYDCLPLVGVVEGAGGVITDWQGRPLRMDGDGRVAAAATPALHAELLEVLARG